MTATGHQQHRGRKRHDAYSYPGDVFGVPGCWWFRGVWRRVREGAAAPVAGPLDEYAQLVLRTAAPGLAGADLVGRVRSP